jgi:hypothetical protein
VHSSLKSKISKPVQFEPIPKWVYDTNTLLPKIEGKIFFFIIKPILLSLASGKIWYIRTIKQWFLKKSRSSKEQKIKLEGRIPHSWVRLTIQIDS